MGDWGRTNIGDKIRKWLTASRLANFKGLKTRQYCRAKPEFIVKKKYRDIWSIG